MPGSAGGPGRLGGVRRAVTGLAAEAPGGEHQSGQGDVAEQHQPDRVVAGGLVDQAHDDRGQEPAQPAGRADHAGDAADLADRISAAPAATTPSAHSSTGTAEILSASQPPTGRARVASSTNPAARLAASVAVSLYTVLRKV